MKKKKKKSLSREMVRGLMGILSSGLPLLGELRNLSINCLHTKCLWKCLSEEFSVFCWTKMERERERERQETNPNLMK